MILTKGLIQKLNISAKSLDIVLDPESITNPGTSCLLFEIELEFLKLCNVAMDWSEYLGQGHPFGNYANFQPFLTPFSLFTLNKPTK